MTSALKPLLLTTSLFLTTCAAQTEAPAPDTTSATAKNVILFVGDGMGVSTVTAARIFDGQAQGLAGEEHYLAFEEFDNVAMVKTYNLDAQVPDSAGTATAIMSGFKANIGAINTLPDAPFAGCGDIPAPPTLLETAKANGRAVGIISTARITHATPAAVYGHTSRRDLEADKDIDGPYAEAGCKSLARQMLEAPLDIALGGGAKEFEGNPVAEWASPPNRHYVVNANELRNVSYAAGDRLVGLFKDSHMSFEADRDDAKEPSLAEMTGFAIDNLSKNAGGYVLMVEAGRVDHAHHGTNAYRALTDMQALNEAVKVAKAKAGEDTLILVTADHSHVFTMAGYPKRGNPILGVVKNAPSIALMSGQDVMLASDGKPYTTLGYHNGPNVRTPDSEALTDEMVADKNYRQQTAIPMRSETHAGEDVPLYATGPGAEHVRGVMDQDEIHGVMMKAMGIETE